MTIHHTHVIKSKIRIDKKKIKVENILSFAGEFIDIITWKGGLDLENNLTPIVPTVDQTQILSFGKHPVRCSIGICRLLLLRHKTLRLLYRLVS